MSIVLAHEADFALGPLTVVPSSRELIDAGGGRHVLEPRVMQVLVALARAEGAVVSKDDLLASCWEGRVVGEDAINRVLSRLRRAAEDEADGAFRIETVTRVGYRLVRDGAGKAASPARRAPSKLSRRKALAGGAAAVVAGGGALWFTSRRPAGAVEFERQAQAALEYRTPEQLSLAISTLRRLTQIEPDRAANWSLLAIGYATLGAQSPDNASLFARAREAGRKARALDRDDPDAGMLELLIEPWYRNWLNWDASARRQLARFPDHPRLNLTYGVFLSQVGRGREALARIESVPAEHRSGPFDGFVYVLLLYGADRLDQADREIERLITAYPQHFAVWFTRSRYLNYTGRSDQALAMFGPGYPKPTGIPQWNFDLSASESRSIMSRRPEDIADTLARYDEAIEQGTGFIQNAIIFDALMGRADEAFMLAQRFYFSIGRTSQRRYSQEQAIYAPRNRLTYFLFSRETSSLRQDARFGELTRKLGLEEFWRVTRIPPDYRKMGADA